MEVGYDPTLQMPKYKLWITSYRLADCQADWDKIPVNSIVLLRKKINEEIYECGFVKTTNDPEEQLMVALRSIQRREGKSVRG